MYLKKIHPDYIKNSYTSWVKRHTNPVENGQKFLNKYLKNDIQKANKDMKKRSTLLVIREMQVKSPEISLHTYHDGGKENK